MAINKDVNVSVNLVVNSKTVSAGLKATETQVQSFFQKLNSLALGIGFGNIISNAFFGIQAAIAATIKEAAIYDQTFKSVAKTTNLSNKELEAMSKSFIALSRTIPVTAQELAEVAVIAGQLGIKGSEAIQAFSKNIAIASVALEMSADDTASALAGIANAAGINLSKTPGLINNIGSAINSLADDSTANAPQIIEAMRKIGNVGAQLGVPVHQLAALATQLINTGVNAEEAGTAIKNAFIFATTNSEKFAKGLGMSKEAALDFFSKDAVGAIQLFAQKVIQESANIGTAQDKLAEVFGTRSIQIVTAITTGAESFKRFSELASTAFANGTSMLNEYNRQAEGAVMVGKLLGNQFDALGKSIATSFLPFITMAMQAMIQFMQNSSQFGVLDALEIQFKQLSPAIQETIKLIAQLAIAWKIFTMMPADPVSALSSFFLSIQSGVLKSITSMQTFKLQMKLGMMDFKATLASGEGFMAGFSTFLKTQWAALNIGAKLWAVGMKVAMAGATLGLTILIGEVLEWVMRFKEEMGGWGNTITFIVNKLKEFGSAIVVYVMEKLVKLFDFMAGMPMIGEKFKLIADGARSMVESVSDAGKKAVSDNLQLQQNAAGVTSDINKAIANDKTRIDAAAMAEGQKNNEAYNKIVADMAKKNNSGIAKVSLEEQEKANKEALTNYERMLRSKHGLTETLTKQMADMETKILVEAQTKRLNTEYNLERTRDQQLLDNKLKLMEQAHQMAMKNSEELTKFSQMGLGEQFAGGEFSAFNRMKESQGTGAAVAGVAGSVAGSMSKGAQGGADMAKGMIKAAANMIPVIGPVMGPLIDMMTMSSEQLRETIRGFIDAGVQIPLQIIENIPVIIEELLNGIPRVIEGFLVGIPRVIDGLVEGLPRVIEGFVDNLPTMIDGLVALLPQFIESLVTNLTLAMPRIAISMATSLSANMPMVATRLAVSLVAQAPKIVSEMIKGLGTGIKDMFKKLNPFGGGGGGIFGSIGKIFKFAEGGVVPGTSFTGDRVMARVNSGERILTPRQNKMFENLVDSSTDQGSTGATQTSIPVGPAIGTVNVVINGAGVSDEKRLAEMVIDKIRTESNRGRKIIQASGVGT